MPPAQGHSLAGRMMRSGRNTSRIEPAYYAWQHLRQRVYNHVDFDRIAESLNTRGAWQGQRGANVSESLSVMGSMMDNYRDREMILIISGNK